MSFTHLPFESDRFWKKVNFHGPIADGMTDECWIWEAADNGSYGLFLHRLGDKATGYAHRFAWQEANRACLMPGSEVDHLCFTPKCVRPSHLDCVSRVENMRRANARITHCPFGHEYDDTNTKFRECQGYIVRQCKACDRENHMKQARLAGVREAGTFRPWNAKLSEEEVREIRARYVPRLHSQSKLAAEYGVSQTLISQVLRRKIWDDVL